MTETRDFWSRRKAAVEAEQQAEARAADDLVQAETLARREEMTDEEILAELDLPDPDSLQLGDDVTRFMARAVPERIRRRALRRLWRTNPVLANLDGMVDYGQDYTDAALVVDGMKSAYQVGKGMLAHIEKLARDAEAVAKAEVSTPESEPEKQEISVAPEQDIADVEIEVAEAAPVAEVVPVPEDMSGAQTPTPRRMRFEFEG